MPASAEEDGVCNSDEEMFDVMLVEENDAETGAR